MPGASATAAASEEGSDSGGSKISKAAILQKCKWQFKYEYSIYDFLYLAFIFPAIDYIQYLEKKKLEEQKELDKIQKEVEGLRIMKQ